MPARRARLQGARPRGRRRGGPTRPRASPRSVANAATPSAKPTTRFVPTALCAVRPDGAEQRRHPQRAEDHADRTADEPDREAEDRRRARGAASARGRARTGRTSRSTPFHASTAAIAAKSRRSGTLEPASAPDHRPDDGRRRHPRDDAPVDAALARVPPAARSGGRSADRDVRPRGRSRVAGGDQDRGQPQRPEHEPDGRSEIPRRERRGEGQRELPGFQSGSSRPAAAFAARARMKRRSERRLR